MIQTEQKDGFDSPIDVGDDIDWQIVYDHRRSVYSALRNAAGSAGQLNKRLSESINQFSSVLSIFDVTLLPARVYMLTTRHPSLRAEIPVRATRTMQALLALRQQMIIKVDAEHKKIDKVRQELAALRTRLTKHANSAGKVRHPERSTKLDHQKIEDDVKAWDDFAHAQAEFLMGMMAAHTSLASALTSLLAPLAQSLPLDLARIHQALTEAAPALHLEILTHPSDEPPMNWVLSDSQLTKVEAAIQAIRERDLTPA